MNSTIENSILSSGNNPAPINWKLRLATIIGGIGLFLLIISLFITFPNQSLVLTIALSSIFAGIIWFGYEKYRGVPEGIKNNGIWFDTVTNKGILAIIVGIIITGFYVLLYFYPSYIGLGKDGNDNTGLVGLFDPFSMFLKNQKASEWFVYGVLYTMAIVGFGFKFMLKYKHNKYQQLRTISVMFFQLGFAFLLPELMMRLNQPYYNFANMWPLNYYFFDEWHIKGLLNANNFDLFTLMFWHDEWHIKDLLNANDFGLFMLIFGLLMVFLISPYLTYKYGKRWYCSWVCGCGGLAETAGDPFRQLSSKKLSAWKLERWMIHLVLVFSFLMTMAVISTYFTNNANQFITRTQFLTGVILFLTIIGSGIYVFKRRHFDKDVKIIILLIFSLIIVVACMMLFSNENSIFGLPAHQLRSSYGFAIGATFSGVIGVGFYPILGNRVWCRFGCPMAAILGLQQKLFSRFRITTNGSQCISCGNCSTYCEMGIDVRAYAQKGQNIVRSSCVGCGVCSAVCPRGVLKLENGSIDIDLRTDIFKAEHLN